MKNKCSSEIPNMPTGCAPDNRRPEKICGTCRYFNPEFPVERNIIFVAQMGDTKTV